MYLFDSVSGGRRRKAVRERVSSTATRINTGTRDMRQDLAGRAQRLAGRAQSLFRRNRSSEPNSPARENLRSDINTRRADQSLARRVRAGLEEVTSRPRVIGVWAEGGRVFLHGDVLQDEHEKVVRAVRSIEGVSEVSDHLMERERADGVWAVRVRQPSAEPRWYDVRQERWSPAARSLAGAIGVGLLVAAVRGRKSPIGALGWMLGAPLLIRTATNAPLKRLGPGRGVIDVHKRILVNAPAERVFRLLAEFENFPTFMRNVRQVRRLADGTSHWIVAGPGGALVEWDALITVNRPNDMLAWRSLPGSRVEHSGVIRLEALGQDQTRVDLHLSYSPPGGALAHTVANVFGIGPAKELEEDLVRVKSFLETWRSAVGKTSEYGAGAERYGNGERAGYVDDAERYAPRGGHIGNA
jgi:uncharacterized membrane protein/osmotically-inducible protein OsmY